MLVPDLILLRILLTGLTVSLVLGLFMALRRLLPKLFSPNHRYMIWLVLLFSSLMIVPLPSLFRLPADLPTWFYQYRLPDPASLPLNEQAVVDYYALDSLGSQIGTGQGTLAEQIGQAMTALGLYPEMNWQEQLLKLLPGLRLLYLAGFLITLLIHIIYYFTRVRNKMICRTISETGREAWQSDIIRMRDLVDNYRQADVMMYDYDCDRPSRWLKNWRKHILPVPTELPEQMSLDARKEWLQVHLDHLAHPGLLPIILWLIVRSLFWFNPFWHSCWRCYADDLTLYKTSRLKKTHGIKNINQNKIIIFISGVISLAVVLTMILFLAWQMPRQFLPDVNISLTGPADDDTVTTRSIPADQFRLADHRLLIDESTILEISDANSRYDGLLRLDSRGEIVWQQSIYGLLDLPVYSSVETLDTCQIADNRWSVAIKTGNSINQAQDIRYVLIDSMGQFISSMSIPLPNEFGRLDSDYSIGITLAPDGGWIESVYSQKNEKLTQTSLAAYHNQKLLRLSRHDAQGHVIWTLDPEKNLLKDINYTFILGARVIKFKMIVQILPTDDGGCYVLTRGQTRLLRIRPETDLEESVYYYDRDQLIYISASGEITRTQDLIGKIGNFQVFRAFLGDTGTLYLAGIDSRPDPGQATQDLIRHTAVQAITMDGKILFTKSAAESGQYNLRGAILHDHQLLLLLDSDDSGSAIYRTDLQGKMQSLDILDLDLDYIPMALVTDDQIVAFSNNLDLSGRPRA